MGDPFNGFGTFGVRPWEVVNTTFKDAINLLAFIFFLDETNTPLRECSVYNTRKKIKNSSINKKQRVKIK